MLPLNVFEERYRLLVRERLDFGVVLVRRGTEVGFHADGDIHRVGTVATFHRVEALPDGRFSVLARGLHRFRLLDLDRSRPYLMGRVERLPDPGAPAGPRLLDLLGRYLAAHGADARPPQVTPELGGRVVWLVGSVLDAEPDLRQRLLESGDPALAEALLAEELARMGAAGRLGTFRSRPPAPN